MEKIISKYFRLMKELKKSSSLLEEWQFYDKKNTTNEWNNRNVIIRIIGYGKKNIKLIDSECNLEELEELGDKISKCEMIVIRAKNVEKDIVLEFLKNYSYKNACYAPIVCSGGEEILFFPRLRFQDSYLLEYILNKQFENEDYRIFYANENQLVVFA